MAPDRRADFNIRQYEEHREKDAESNGKTAKVETAKLKELRLSVNGYFGAESDFERKKNCPERSMFVKVKTLA